MGAGQLQGKRVLVTGASSGLGRHFARVLAGEGASLVLAARRVDSLEELAADLHAEFGCEADVAALDVCDPGSVRAAVAGAGPFDVLVNNAGVSRAGAVLGVTCDDYDFVMDTNLRGAFLVAQETARGMRDAGRGGSIVNVASVLGLRQGGQVTTYAMSKAGIVQMTKQMGLELARFGIRVNALAPGYVATEMNGDFLAGPAGEAMKRRIPQRRFGTLEDMDGPLLLLCSDASLYMTGAVIPVDGGHLLSSL